METQDAVAAVLFAGAAILAAVDAVKAEGFKRFDAMKAALALAASGLFAYVTSL